MVASDAAPVREQGEEFAFQVPGLRRLPEETLLQFSRQLAVLLQAGVPITRGITLLIAQTGHRGFREALKDVYLRLNNGVALSHALSGYPEYFSSLFTSMVRVGEVHGDLAGVMCSLADYQEREFALRKKIRQAMTYPALILGLSLAFTVAIFNFVLPHFVNVFESLHVKLPFVSQVLVWLVRLANDPLAAVLIALMLGSGLHLFRCYLHTSTGRYWLDSVKIRLPIMGPLVRKIAVGRVARGLSLLLSGGVHLSAAMDLTGLVCDNAVYERVLTGSSKVLSEGRTLTSIFQLDPFLFPPSFVQMCAVGEETGRLEVLLGKIAELYEMDVNHAFNSFAATIEPLLVMFTGAVVGLIVLAVFLPLYSYINQL